MPSKTRLPADKQQCKSVLTLAKPTKEKITWGTRARNGAAEFCQSQWYGDHGYHLIAEGHCIYQRFLRQGAYSRRLLATLQVGNDFSVCLQWQAGIYVPKNLDLISRVERLVGVDRQGAAVAYRRQYLEPSYPMGDHAKKARERYRSRTRPSKKEREQAKLKESRFPVLEL
jgi:hypothetical protein